LKEATDDDLMQGVATGDGDAFAEIILRYQHVAWKVAFRFLGDSMEAEDAAQDAFLKLLEAAPRYRSKASFRTYLFRILTHLCIDRCRKKRPDAVADIPEAADPSGDPAAALMAREIRVQIRNVLETLPPKQKAAIILRHYEGLSYAEIAQVLGISAKAVERLISRARITLQTRLSFLNEK
jgi:RNA polymerase sigma-70 factor (ECF subfamily)